MLYSPVDTTASLKYILRGMKHRRLMAYIVVSSKVKLRVSISK